MAASHPFSGDARGAGRTARRSRRSVPAPAEPEEAEALVIVRELLASINGSMKTPFHQDGQDGHRGSTVMGCSTCTLYAWVGIPLLKTRGAGSTAASVGSPVDGLDALQAGIAWLSAPKRNESAATRRTSLVEDMKRQVRSLNGFQQRFDRFPKKVEYAALAAAAVGELRGTIDEAAQVYRELFTVAHCEGDLADLSEVYDDEGAIDLGGGELFFRKVVERIWLRAVKHAVQAGDPLPAEPADGAWRDAAHLFHDLRRAVAAAPAAAPKFDEHIDAPLRPRLGASASVEGAGGEVVELFEVIEAASVTDVGDTLLGTLHGCVADAAASVAAELGVGGGAHRRGPALVDAVERRLEELVAEAFRAEIGTIDLRSLDAWDDVVAEAVESVDAALDELRLQRALRSDG